MQHDAELIHQAITTADLQLLCSHENTNILIKQMYNQNGTR